MNISRTSATIRALNRGCSADATIRPHLQEASIDKPDRRRFTVKYNSVFHLFTVEMWLNYPSINVINVFHIDPNAAMAPVRISGSDFP
ncbi:hypothetical protein ABKN59_000201 [Abortiporus biennis]